MADDLERLARAAPGGSTQRPIEVESPAQVDVIAGRTPCSRCRGSLRVDEHVARVVDEHPYRVAAVTCTMCGTTRELFFRLKASRLH